MPVVSIVSFSGTGHTTKLAEAMAKGAASVDTIKTNLILLSGEDIVKGRYQNETVFAHLDASDAIIFGSPTYMGGPAGEFKAFADASSGKFFKRVWRDKIAAGFTVSNSPSGDKFSTLQYFFTLAMQHGMIWVGLGELPHQANGVNRLGSFSGAMASAGKEPVDIAPDAEDRMTGEILGQRVAQFTLKLTTK
ncbi:MAG TPA: flavodoxin family protein [Verrucomicrobiae bacterium]|jgi:NAD(P)H dehydrogenase (quinone)|nr:flavodoxin family protein [Verrucomicrobiae bacterium]